MAELLLSLFILVKRLVLGCFPKSCVILSKPEMN